MSPFHVFLCRKRKWHGKKFTCLQQWPWISKFYPGPQLSPQYFSTSPLAKATVLSFCSWQWDVKVTQLRTSRSCILRMYGRPLATYNSSLFFVKYTVTRAITTVKSFQHLKKVTGFMKTNTNHHGIHKTTWLLDSRTLSASYFSHTLFKCVRRVARSACYLHVHSSVCMLSEWLPLDGLP